MQKYRKVSLLMIMLGLALVLSQSPAHAQTPTTAGIWVWASNNDTQENYIEVVAPDGTTSNKMTLNANVRVTMSPDAKWLTQQVSATDTDPEKFTYSQIGGETSVVIPVAKGYSAMTVLFSNDSRYLLYSLVETFTDANAHWAIGIVTLDSGKVVEYNEPFLPSSSLGKGLVGSPLYFDGKQVILRAYLPFADGNFGGLFVLPIANLQNTTAGMYPMPKSTRFVQPNSQVNLTLISPDGKQVAYLFGDKSNPPTNYTGEGPQFFLNTIAVVDVATSKSKVIAQAGKGQALGSAIWSGDGKSLIFSGGNFQNTSFLITPKVYRVTVADGQVTELGTPLTDAKLQLQDMKVCGDRFNFVAGKTDGPGVTLNSAPLASLAPAVASVKASSVWLLACAPASTT